MISYSEDYECLTYAHAGMTGRYPDTLISAEECDALDGRYVPFVGQCGRPSDYGSEG